MLIKIVLAIIITEANRIAARAAADSWGAPKVKEQWSKLQLYALILLSLTSNIVLNALGYLLKNRRGKTWVAFLTRLGYFVGDLAATTALTTLLKLHLHGKADSLLAFWGPFLLLHLGSAETIAAHFFDEKKLWRTYTLGLIIQSGIAFYMVLRFERGPDNSLTYISIPIFAAGFLKCMERIWILRFSGFKQLIEAALSGTHPKMSGSKSSRHCDSEHNRLQLDAHLNRKSIIQEGKHLYGAHLSFMMFVPLFADIDLRFYKNLSDIFTLESAMSAEDAFKMVDTELDFLFDVLYTKTIIVNIPLGFTIRIIYFLFSTAALLGFSYAYTNKQDHSKLEISITYFLLFEAFFSNTIAVISHLFSNWTLVWLINPPTWRHLPKFVRSNIASCLKLKRSLQGVKYMAQHSLLTYSLRGRVNKFNSIISKVAAKRVLKLFWDIQTHAWVDMGPTWALVDANLKKLIFSRLLQKRQKYSEGKFKFSCLSHLATKGASDVLKDKVPKTTDGRPNVYEEIKWSINKVEFTHSVLLWHIATDILFHYYERRNPDSARGKYHQISKKLSDYMIHLLVMRSFMLHSGISKLRYGDTCLEAVNFFGWQVDIERTDLAEAAMTLFVLDVESRNSLLEIDDSVQVEGGKSVFFKGCELAKQLQSFVANERWDSEELWEMIGCVWTEMLFSAAYDCDWKQHAYQLGNGGELLTHVALLMAHLGLSKHLRLTNHPREAEGCQPPWDWNNINQMAYYLA